LQEIIGLFGLERNDLLKKVEKLKNWKSITNYLADGVCPIMEKSVKRQINNLSVRPCQFAASQLPSLSYQR